MDEIWISFAKFWYNHPAEKSVKRVQTFIHVCLVKKMASLTRTCNSVYSVPSLALPEPLICIRQFKRASRSSLFTGSGGLCLGISRLWEQTAAVGIYFNKNVETCKRMFRQPVWGAHFWHSVTSYAQLRCKASPIRSSSRHRSKRLCCPVLTA